jgi:hypothetical protein
MDSLARCVPQLEVSIVWENGEKEQTIFRLQTRRATGNGRSRQTLAARALRALQNEIASDNGA